MVPSVEITEIYTHAFLTIYYFFFFFHFSIFFSFLVTSGSTNASGVDGNQRRLDWDPLADFGYEAHISRVCQSDFT